MNVDGRVVGRALNSELRPVLRDEGFDRFQGKNAWRRNELTVDLVSFSSMNAYIAHAVGCTSFSLQGDAGVYYPSSSDSNVVEWPRATDLTIKGGLRKTIRQPIFRPSGKDWDEEWRHDRADTWYVLEDGSNLGQVIADVIRVVREQVLPFLHSYDEPARALHALTTPPPKFESGDINKGQDFGRLHQWRFEEDSRPYRELVDRIGQWVD